MYGYPTAMTAMARIAREGRTMYGIGLNGLWISNSCGTRFRNQLWKASTLKPLCTRYNKRSASVWPLGDVVQDTAHTSSGTRR